MTSLVIVLIAAAIIAAIVVSWYAKKQRRSDLATFALRHHLNYDPDDRFGLLQYDFRLFRHGDERGCENTMWGEWQGKEIVAADYWYYTEHTDTKGHTTRDYSHFSVAVIHIAVDVPRVTIEREGFFGRVADHLGFRDIEFESEEFNRRFQISSDDRAFAFKLIDARMMRWLLSLRDPICFEIRKGLVLAYIHRLRPHELLTLFGAVHFFEQRIPGLVWREYRGAAHGEGG